MHRLFLKVIKLVEHIFDFLLCCVFRHVLGECAFWNDWLCWLHHSWRIATWCLLIIVCVMPLSVWSKSRAFFARNRLKYLSIFLRFNIYHLVYCLVFLLSLSVLFQISQVNWIVLMEEPVHATHTCCRVWYAVSNHFRVFLQKLKLQQLFIIELRVIKWEPFLNWGELDLITTWVLQLIEELSWRDYIFENIS